MGTAGRHTQIALALIMALASAAAASPAAPFGAAGRVERLPITGMLKVTQPDGSVVYLSTDRRFVFRGEMTDLWTGTDLSLGELENRLDLDRNGVSVEKISLAIGRGQQPLTVFVAPECEQCRTVVEMLLEPAALKAYRSRVVLLDSSPGGARANAVVWCAADPAEALRSVYLEGRQPKSAAPVGAPCDQLGLEQGRSAARLFGIAQLPLLVDANGVGHVGVPSSLASLGRGDSQ